MNSRKKRKNRRKGKKIKPKKEKKTKKNRTKPLKKPKEKLPPENFLEVPKTGAEKKPYELAHYARESWECMGVVYSPFPI